MVSEVSTNATVRRRMRDFFIFSPDHLDDLRRGAGGSSNPTDNSLHTRACKPHVTLLSRQHHYVLPCALIQYALLQYIIGSKSNICTDQREPPSLATTTIYYCAAACFLMSGIQQIIKIYSYRNQSGGCMSRSLYLAALIISIIAGTSSYLTGTRSFKDASALNGASFYSIPNVRMTMACSSISVRRHLSRYAWSRVTVRSVGRVAD